MKRTFDVLVGCHDTENHIEKVKAETSTEASASVRSKLNRGQRILWVRQAKEFVKAKKEKAL